MKSARFSKKRIAFTVIAAILVFAISFGLLAAFMPVAEPTHTSLEAKAQKGETAGSAYISVCTASDGSELLVNTKTSAVTLKSPSGEEFNAFSNDAAAAHLACVLKVRARDRSGNTYDLNSTDNSIAFGTYSYQSADNKTPAHFVFDFYKDEKAAEKGPDFTSGNIFFRMTVYFTLENGFIKAYVDTTAIDRANGLRIESIAILPGLAAIGVPVSGDGFIVPDGCGAKISVDGNYGEDLDLSLSVYGTDVAYGEYSGAATLPFYAVTKRGTLLNVIAVDGDAISEIVLKRSANGGGYAYTEFNVTPCAYLDGRLYEGARYDGVIAQRYVFSANKDADYCSSAAIMKDYLIQKGYMSEKSSVTVGDLPFFVTVVGSKTGELGDKLTTFDDAAEIIALLKSKGVRSISLRFAGGINGGIGQTSGNMNELAAVLGGTKSYESLNATAKNESSTVWLDMNIAVSGGKNSSMPFKSDVYNIIHGAMQMQNAESTLCDWSQINSNLSNAFDFTCGVPAGNYCLNDISFLLYSDNKAGINRQQALENIRDKVGSVAVNGKIMLAKPAAYLLNSASAIAEVPQTASCDGISGVSVVPLLQMILHGSISYGCTPVNLYGDEDLAVLKAVEYGASPSFLFTHADCGGLEYGIHASQTAKYYTRIKQLMTLTDMTITSHEEIAAGVFKVIYDFNKVVYVNYNPAVVNVDGIFIDARDFVII